MFFERNFFSLFSDLGCSNIVMVLCLCPLKNNGVFFFLKKVYFVVYGFDLRLFALFWVLLAEFTVESPTLGL